MNSIIEAHIDHRLCFYLALRSEIMECKELASELHRGSPERMNLSIMVNLLEDQIKADVYKKEVLGTEPLGEIPNTIDSSTNPVSPEFTHSNHPIRLSPKTLYPVSTKKG